MSNQNELFLDHEVRIRMMETAYIKMDERFEKIDKKFEHFENRMHSNFLWILGIQFATLLAIITMFGGIILTMNGG